MESTATDNQEVEELFDVVFKLSAKDIDGKLKKVINRPDIAKRRWFWELLQNAKDAVEPTEKVSVKLSIDPDENNSFVEFRHNGNPFRYRNGIPQAILDKIFQPFFTTKPTGQGTGLRLSLGYDIIKAHGGQIKVETKEGEGSTFVIQLPITTR
jgi:signal transduction histidine kinase